MALNAWESVPAVLFFIWKTHVIYINLCLMQRRFQLSKVLNILQWFPFGVVKTPASCVCELATYFAPLRGVVLAKTLYLFRNALVKHYTRFYLSQPGKISNIKNAPTLHQVTHREPRRLEQDPSSSSYLQGLAVAGRTTLHLSHDTTTAGLLRFDMAPNLRSRSVTATQSSRREKRRKPSYFRGETGICSHSGLLAPARRPLQKLWRCLCRASGSVI